MMIHIANPIYDSVFKYLMEDERIAKIILSALLKKEVVDVQVRRNEYTNGTRDQVSMFRIDFGAQIRNEDGSLQLILIELQKTWLETETLRFRQYLGAHYANPENILQENNPEGYAIPMVTVYLLGHRVGDIEEPVLYVNHKAFNYQGDEASKGLPNPFVASLVHDSIIVQIPLPHGQINNKLEKVLSIFDQHRKAGFNRQVLTLEEDIYSDDSDMVYVLRRLLAAASDTKLRHDMNVEDEFFSAIENRDTAIMARDKRIQEQDFLISEQSNTITEQSNIITEQSDLLKKMAKSMLSNGIAIEDIASATGKSVDAIRQLLSD